MFLILPAVKCFPEPDNTTTLQSGLLLSSSKHLPSSLEERWKVNIVLIQIIKVKNKYYIHRALLKALKRFGLLSSTWYTNGFGTVIASVSNVLADVLFAFNDMVYMPEI